MIRRTLLVLVLALALGIGLVLTSPARAQYLVSDVANLTETISASYHALQSWMEENVLMQKAMDQAGMNTSLEVDSINNAMANMIVRQGATSEEIQNLQVLQESMPAQDACEAVTLSVNLEDVICGVEDEVVEASDRQIDRLNTLEMTEEGQIDAHIRTSVGELLAECQDMSTTDGMGTACLETQDLLGGSIPTLTEDQARSTEAQIALLIDPVPDRMVNPRQNQALTEEQRLEGMRVLGLKSLASNSMLMVRAERLSVDGQPSRLQLLKTFAEEHFGTAAGADFLAVMTNTHEDKTESLSKQSTPSQVMRSMAVMDAFLVYMDVLKYEQQLRMEVLQAGLLAVTVEPPK